MEEESRTDPVIEVVADDREAGTEVVQCLSNMTGVRLRIERLRTGDYQVDQRCLFERKTILDFAQSIMDGRLFSQAQRLCRSQLRCAVLLEGKLADLAATGMRREALQGAMISLSLIYEIPVLRSLAAEETARLLIYAANQLRRESTGAIPLRGRRPKRRQRIQLGILQGLPGIGPGRAQDLLEHFQSVAAVMTARMEELKEVEGIGEKTAETIRWALEPEPKEER